MKEPGRVAGTDGLLTQVEVSGLFSARLPEVLRTESRCQTPSAGLCSAPPRSTPRSRRFARAPASVPSGWRSLSPPPAPRACFHYVLMNVALRISCKGKC